jgi:serine/threonine-protein kinase
MVGTLQYMSPEQVRGEETDARSDIYALGILLYDLLTGRVPFQRTNDYDLMRAHVEKAPPPPRWFSPDLPEGVEAALLRSLEKRPEERFATTRDFREALEAGAGGALDLRETPREADPAQAEVTDLLDDAALRSEDPTRESVARGWPSPRLSSRIAQGSAAALGGLVLLLGLNLLRPEPSAAPQALSLRSGLAADTPLWVAPSEKLEAWPGLLPSDFPEPTAPRRKLKPKRKAAPPQRTASAPTRPKPPPAKVAPARPAERAEPAPSEPVRSPSAPAVAGDKGWVIRRR